MVKFFFPGSIWYNLMKAQRIWIWPLEWKNNVYKTFTRQDISNPLPFCTYYYHTPATTHVYIAYDLVLLDKVIKVIPYLDWFALKPFCKRP